jgi:hypothetical protein
LALKRKKYGERDEEKEEKSGRKGSIEKRIGKKMELKSSITS